MKTVLISGAGITGPTLAFWLKAGGFELTLIERARALRTGGYVVDFWGPGYDIAERMGIITEIDHCCYHVQELRIVDDAGRRLAGFGAKVFTELTGGRYVGRSDLSRLLFEKVEGRTESIFGDEIITLHEEPDCVWVELKHAAERRFDLEIGALRDIYWRGGWECQRILDEPDWTGELYFDRSARSEWKAGRAAGSRLWGCRLLRVTVGRPGLGASNDFRLCPGG